MSYRLEPNLSRPSRISRFVLKILIALSPQHCLSALTILATLTGKKIC
jgi:hypothetical protein